MRVVAIALTVLLASTVAAQAKAPPARAPSRPAPVPHVWVRPAAPLPMLPGIGRVRIDPARDSVVVLEEVNLPRGEWQSGGLDLYVAFGAPGTPLAIDARLVAVPYDVLESRLEDAGDPLVLEPAVHHTPSTQLLLGRPQMAGVIVHVKESDLRRVFATSDLAGLRLRSLLAPPAADDHGRREVVVRLGIAGGLPLTIGDLQVVSRQGAPIVRAEAALCGPEADPWPLAISVVPKAADPAPPAEHFDHALSPAMALRHASDDLCVRWWTQP
jgi:hypothetical protein